MFGSTDPEITTFNQESKGPVEKKFKIDTHCKTKQVHSSLGYESIRAPPLVVYKSVNSYFERNYGPSLALSTSGVNGVQSVSSPIVFKTPPAQPGKRLLTETAMPYVWFTVRELSTVKCLKNWSNQKVNVIGQVSFKASVNTYYLYTTCEKVQVPLTLDISLLKEIPKLEQLLQLYGTLEIKDSTPFLKVFFTRSLSWVALPQLIESYKLMQNTVKIVQQTSQSDDIFEGPKRIFHNLQMNNTLDECSFSSVP